MQLSVKADFDSVYRVLGEIQGGLVRRAAAAALNRAAVKVRTVAVREIKQRRALPTGVIRAATRIERASPAMLRTGVVASGRPIPLRDYQAHRTRHGVTVRVESDGPRKTVHHHGNLAWLHERFAGGNVFAREGRARLPIKKLYGPSIPSAMVRQAVASALQHAATQAWLARWRHELSYRLRSAGLRVSGF